jgi:hypothetical protein
MKDQKTIAAALTVLVALLVGSLATARPPEEPDDVRKLLKELKEELAEMRKARALENQVIRQQMNDFRDRLDTVERRLDRVTRRDYYYDPDRLSSPSTRGSLSITPAPFRSGRIRLDNRLGVEALVTIDGIAYTVPPLSVRELRDQPAGRFTYDVTADGYGVSSQRRRTLASGETWTLTIY